MPQEMSTPTNLHMQQLQFEKASSELTSSFAGGTEEGRRHGPSKDRGAMSPFGKQHSVNSATQHIMILPSVQAEQQGTSFPSITGSYAQQYARQPVTNPHAQEGLQQSGQYTLQTHHSAQRPANAPTQRQGHTIASNTYHNNNNNNHNRHTSTSAPTHSLLGFHTRDEHDQECDVPDSQIRPSPWSSVGGNEIEPCTEQQEDAHRHQASASSGGTTRTSGTPSSRPMSIPGGSTPRMYRVITSPHPSGSAGTGTAPLQSTAERNVITVLVDQAKQPEAQATSSPSVPTSRNLNFLGGLFSRSSRGHTPESSVHGADLLPHHYRPSPGAEAVLSSASPSLEASSVLSRAIGSLRKQQKQAPQVPQTSPSSATRGRPKMMRASASVDNLALLHQQQTPHGSGSLGMGLHSARSARQFGELRYPHIYQAQQQKQSQQQRQGGGNAWRSGASVPQPIQSENGRKRSMSLGAGQSNFLHRSSSLMALLASDTGDATISTQDIALLSSSLPANFGQPSASMLRHVDSMATPAVLSRAASSSMSEDLRGIGQMPTTARSGSSAVPPACPICLICLEMLAPEDFASGEAMYLQCLCKGDLAVRHRACAIEWSNVKGNLLCDICKHPIENLPEIDPAIVAAREAARRRRQPHFAVTAEPTTADYIFDAIRVAWVTIICCILFVDGLSISKTFMIGASVGTAYITLSLALQWCCNRMREQRRARLLARQQASQQRQTPANHHVIDISAGGVDTSQGSDGLLQPLLIPGQ